MADLTPLVPVDAPLHDRLQQAAYTLTGIPRPDQPLTDDQAADVFAAAHLMMRASARLEVAEERLSRQQTAARRRDRIITAVLVMLAVSWLVFCAVGIALDIAH